LEGIQSGSGGFEKFGAGSVSWGSLTAPGDQIPEGRSDRPDMRSNRPSRCELFLLLVCIPMLRCCIGSGECALAQGELAYVQGEPLCEFAVCGLVCLWWSLLLV
jgi:hypothetical protein